MFITHLRTHIIKYNNICLGYYVYLILCIDSQLNSL